MTYTWAHTCTTWQDAERKLLGLKWRGFGVYTPPSRTGKLIVCYQRDGQPAFNADAYDPASHPITVYYRSWQ